MNKKLFLGMFAAAGMLFATSCSNDELDAVQSGNEARVSFSLGLEGGIATRAISDGTSADKLVYAVFDKDGNRISGIDPVTRDKVTFPATETLTLAKGQTYKVAFWAQDTDCNAYTVDTETMSVTVDYEGDNNDETRDAFFKTETFTVSGNAEIKVVLKRPFAQINVGVTEDDWNAAVASDITIENSSVVIKNAATSINLLDGTVSGETEVSYSLAAIPTEKLEVETDATKEGKEKYTYLSMSYILANEETTGYEKTTLEGLSFTFASQGNPIVFNEGLNNVPVQRNWRTNILGQLLTGTIDFNITIDPIYDGDNNIIDGTESTNEIAPGVTVEGNTYRISSAAGLKWLSDVVNGTATTASGYAQDFTQSNFSGKTVVLTNDIDLTNVDWTPISEGCKVGGDGLGQAFSGTFDGGNHTISNMTVKGQGYVGLFAKAVGTIKNVKMRNVTVEGTTFVGAVIGYIYGTVENCHVDGGNVTAKVADKKDNNGNNVGGIVGFVGEGSGVVTGNSVKNLNVTAYRTVGGIAGRVLSSTTVTENILDNVAVVADMLQDGGETVDNAKAGQVVGDNMANADLSSNTVNNVTVKVYGIENGVATVGTANGLIYALEQNITDIQLKAGEYTMPDNSKFSENVVVTCEEGTVFTGSSNLNIAGATIIGAEFSNPTGTAVTSTINGKFEDCAFTGTNGLRWCYVGQTVEFENCVFDGSTYGVHFDGGANDIVFRNCTISGFNALAGAIELVTFEDCTFKSTGKSSYNGANLWGSAKLIRCEFTFDGTATTEWIDCIGTDKTYEFTNCTINGTPYTADNYKDYLDYIESRNEITVKINGVECEM